MLVSPGRVRMDQLDGVGNAGGNDDEGERSVGVDVPEDDGVMIVDEVAESDEV
tara:strand:- start:89 stop:247 length:159 start_codon:yes stop_codon:yes gene_type:complete